MGNLSTLASENNNEMYAFIRLTVSGVVKGAPGQLGGFIVASGTPTVQLYDNATTNTGTIMLNTMQTAVGIFYRIPVGFVNGCFAQIVGTADITFFYN